MTVASDTISLLCLAAEFHQYWLGHVEDVEFESRGACVTQQFYAEAEKRLNELPQFTTDLPVHVVH